MIMNYWNFFIVYLVLGQISVFCASNVALRSFFSTLGVEGYFEQGLSLSQTHDGGYLVAGYTDSIGVGSNDVILAKYFFNGTLEWAKTLGGFELDEGRYLSETSDGGYVVVGYTRSFGAGEFDVLLFKLYPNGTLEWAEIFGGDSNDIGYSVSETSGGGYVVTGYTESFGAGGYDVLLAKYYSNGTVDWVKTIGGGSNDVGNSVSETSDEGYIVTGYTYSQGEGSADVLLAKFYRNGTLDWASSVGGEFQDEGKSVVETSDGGYVVTGFTYSFGAGNNDLLLAKYYRDGTLDWAKTLGGDSNDKGFSVIETSGGEFLVTGYFYCSVAGGYDILVAKFYSDGTLDWVESHGGVGSDQGFSISQASDGVGYVISGQSNGDLFVLYVADFSDERTCMWKPFNSSVVIEDVSSSVIKDFWTSVWSVDQTESFNNKSTIIPTMTDIIGLAGNVTFTLVCERFFECFGVLGNETDLLCSGRGDCVDYDVCQCFDNYYGAECNITTCGVIFSNSSDIICTRHGECVDYNDCVCTNSSFYNGNLCQYWNCFGIPSNDSVDVCNGHGTCSDFDKCDPCNENYFGVFCDITICNSVFTNDSVNYGGCSNHGECVSYEHCDCEPLYFGEDCSVVMCFNITSNRTTSVCSGHGTCEIPDTCKCVSEDYSGGMCQFWSCFDVPVNDSSACSGHGFCFSQDYCICNPGYSSSSSISQCDKYNCGIYLHDDTENVCNGRGICESSHKCDCDINYYGDLCELYQCAGLDANLRGIVCNGHGECVSPDTCECSSSQYVGKECQINSYLYTIMAPILGVFGTFIAVVIIIIVLSCLICLVCGLICVICGSVILAAIVFRQKFRMKKFDRLKNVDLLLKEQELEEDDSIAHLRINRHLFEIGFDEIKTIGILGEGGSSSVVYKAKWARKIVAFKCFRTRLLCSKQDKFDEFEREVDLMATLNHPNIISFYGASLQPPRVGIVMEFCENGELLDFIVDFSQQNDGKKYPFEEKLRICEEIISVFIYLHSRKVLHRDLKSENVLVDEKESIRIMDFGLSRLMSSISLQKTIRIGTSSYMAPEVIKTAYYNEKCDVFSFAILMWVIFTEQSKPYEDEYQVELKVANDPTYRPRLDLLREALENQNEWIVELICLCWSDNHKLRLSFEEIGRKFESQRIMEDNTDTLSSNKSSMVKKVTVRRRPESEINLSLVEENEMLKEKVERQKKEIQRLESENKRLKQ